MPAIAAAAACGGGDEAPTPPATTEAAAPASPAATAQNIPGLSGTSWRLVEFQSMDDAQGTTRPDDPSLYTMTLNADGTASLRLNCNRATGSWTAEPSGIFAWEPYEGGS